jgi:hypothetical protein
MWIPSRLETAIEQIRASLSAIQESLREQVASIKKANDSNEEAREDDRRERFGSVIRDRHIRHSAQRQAKTQADKNVHQQIILNYLTFFAVAGAWIYAGIAAYQLYEMRAQTDIATNNQIQATKDAAAASIVTQKQLVIAQQQANAATNAVQQEAKDAKNAVAESERMLNAQTRPWIDLEIGKVNVEPGKIIGGFGHINISVEYSLRNFGNSPAVRQVHGVHWQTAEQGEYIPIKREWACSQELDSLHRNMSQGPIFPNINIPGEPVEKKDFSYHRTTIIAVGCVAYQGSLDDKDARPHTTAIKMIIRTDDDPTTGQPEITESRVLGIVAD